MSTVLLVRKTSDTCQVSGWSNGITEPGDLPSLEDKGYKTQLVSACRRISQTPYHVSLCTGIAEGLIPTT